MTAFLIDHLPGCTPLSPCASCEGARFLRGKLSEEDFNTLVQMVGGSNKPPFSSHNPAPLETYIATLQLSVRADNGLRNDNIWTVGDLIKKTEAELLRTPNFGRATVNEIKEALAGVGRHLAEPNIIGVG